MDELDTKILEPITRSAWERLKRNADPWRGEQELRGREPDPRVQLDIADVWSRTALRQS